MRKREITIEEWRERVYRLIRERAGFKIEMSEDEGIGNPTPAFTATASGGYVVINCGGLGRWKRFVIITGLIWIIFRWWRFVLRFHRSGRNPRGCVERDAILAGIGRVGSVVASHLCVSKLEALSMAVSDLVRN